MKEETMEKIAFFLFGIWIGVCMVAIEIMVIT